jgi:hypothetical protein
VFCVSCVFWILEFVFALIKLCMFLKKKKILARDEFLRIFCDFFFLVLILVLVFYFFPLSFGLKASSEALPGGCVVVPSSSGF